MRKRRLSSVQTRAASSASGVHAELAGITSRDKPTAGDLTGSPRKTFQNHPPLPIWLARFIVAGTTSPCPLPLIAGQKAQPLPPSYKDGKPVLMEKPINPTADHAHFYRFCGQRYPTGATELRHRAGEQTKFAAISRICAPFCGLTSLGVEVPRYSTALIAELNDEASPGSAKKLGMRGHATRHRESDLLEICGGMPGLADRRALPAWKRKKLCRSRGGHSNTLPGCIVFRAGVCLRARSHHDGQAVHRAGGYRRRGAINKTRPASYLACAVSAEEWQEK